MVTYSRDLTEISVPQVGFSVARSRPWLFVVVDPLFQRASPLDGRDSLFVLLENYLKKMVWSRHLFLFYFKGEKQNKKEKP